MKPKKPFKNIQDARQQMSFNNVMGFNNKDFWPCLRCNGNGWDPDSDVEDSWGKWVGHSAPYDYCETCKGNKTSDPKEFKKWYLDRLKIWHKQCDEYEMGQDLYNKACAVLTVGELKKLSKWIIKKHF